MLVAKKASSGKKKTKKKASAKRSGGSSASVSGKKKAGAKKSASKKTASKKGASKKKTGVKKAPSKAGASKKKAAAKKVPAKKSGSSKKAASGGVSKKAPAKKAASKSGPAKSGSAKKEAAGKAGGSNATGEGGGAASGSNSGVGKKKEGTTKKKSAGAAKKGSGSGGEVDGGGVEKPAAERFRGVFSMKGGGGGGASAAAELLKSAGLTGEERTHAAAGEKAEYEKLKKSPFNKRQLEKFRNILRIKRAQLVGDVTNMEAEALMRGESGSLSHLPQHMADAGSDTYDQSLNLNLAAGQRRLLREIDDALDRIERGTFGICERLGKAIGEERLEHTPWARYSIEGAREMERLGLTDHRVPNVGLGGD